MKIKLINPSSRNKGQRNILGFDLYKKSFGINSALPLAISTIAKITPKDIEIIITDENVENIDFDEKVDLVGITSMTPNVLRAYEIADIFREKCIKIILGGVHVSMLPQEAVLHADSVAIGEAEAVWKDVLQDLKEGVLKKFYTSKTRPDLSKLSELREIDTSENNYFLTLIQTTRGCPFNCNFCLVQKFLGNEVRLRNVEQVIKEVLSLPKTVKAKVGPIKLNFPCNFFVVDDNIIGNVKHAEKLLKKLISLKLPSLICQTSINIAKNKKILGLLRDAGCKELFIGFESLAQTSLNNFGKKVNIIAEYETAIDTITSFGINVFGSFIIGGDGDDEKIFEVTADFINKTNIYVAMINILTPIPGTELFNKLEAEDRLLHKNWNLYDAAHVVFKPKHMSVRALQQGYNWLCQNVYSNNSIIEKLLNPSIPGKSYITILQKMLYLPCILKLLINTNNKPLVLQIIRKITLKNKPFNYAHIIRYLGYADFAYSLSNDQP